MAANDRIALSRPINTAGGTEVATFGSTGGTHIHYDFISGTWWSLLGLLKDIEDTVEATFTGFTVRLNDDYKVVFTFTSPQPITFDDTDFRDLLGFNANSSSATTHTAQYVSEYLWISTYAPSDQVDFTLDLGKNWAGTRALDGNIAGTSLYPNTISTTEYCLGFSKTITLSYEPSQHVLMSHAAVATDTTRSLEWFIIQARSATCVYATDPAATGFFFYWHASDLQAYEIWDRPDIYHGIAERLAVCQFCQPALDGFSRPTPALPAGRSRLNVRITIHQAEYPSGFLGASGGVQ